MSVSLLAPLRIGHTPVDLQCPDWSPTWIPAQLRSRKPSHGLIYVPHTHCPLACLILTTGHARKLSYHFPSPALLWCSVSAYFLFFTILIVKFGEKNLSCPPPLFFELLAVPKSNLRNLTWSMGETPGSIERGSSPLMPNETALSTSTPATFLAAGRDMCYLNSYSRGEGGRNIF